MGLSIADFWRNVKADGGESSVTGSIDQIIRFLFRYPWFHIPVCPCTKNRCPFLRTPVFCRFL